MTTRFRKDPDAILDYKVDWTNWLPTGDTIVSAQAIADTGITVISETYTSADHTFWLGGGTINTTYNVISRIWTAGGRRNDQTLVFSIENR